MPVTKKRINIMPQLIHPIKAQYGKNSSILLVISGVCGTTVFVVLGIYNPSGIALYAALAGFFAGFAATALFKTQETQDEVLNHRRNIAGPLVHRSRLLLESRKSDAPEFISRLAMFEELEDSEHFAFLSQELQGTYLDCVEEGEKHLKVLTGEAKVTVIPNTFGITAENIDGKDISFRPLARLLRMLMEGCRREARLAAPLRTLRAGRERSVKIGKFVLYTTIEETSAD
jgi:hypothetical protein